jgi:hypothetical protein
MRIAAYQTARTAMSSSVRPWVMMCITLWRRAPLR